jgi:hypothetical protein
VYRILGLPGDEVGQSVPRMIEYVHPDDRERMDLLMADPPGTVPEAGVEFEGPGDPGGRRGSRRARRGTHRAR